MGEVNSSHMTKRTGSFFSFRQSKSIIWDLLSLLPLLYPYFANSSVPLPAKIHLLCHIQELQMYPFCLLYRIGLYIYIFFSIKHPLLCKSCLPLIFYFSIIKRILYKYYYIGRHLNKSIGLKHLLIEKF